MITSPQHITLSQLTQALRQHPAVLEKVHIARAYSPASAVNHNIPLGDDCAALPDPASGGHLLFATEGMLESFVRDDPWFAGYSAVMVNLSDIAAMGGRPTAITNTLWTPDPQATHTLWQGMQAASIAYHVPIVGGHTTQSPADAPLHLAASVLGRAGPQLLTSFDAQAGDALFIAIDMQGAFRRNKPFWNASTSSSHQHLRDSLDLLPQLAEQQLCYAAKDISNGGIIGTLAMLTQSSQVGATLQLDKLPKPAGCDWLTWLTAFPSYGYLLAIPAHNSQHIHSHFAQCGITTACIGHFTQETNITLQQKQQSETFIPL